MRIAAAVTAAAAALALAGCENHRAPLSDDFGDAVRQNMAVHTIDPSPDHPTAVAPTWGARAADATARYRAGGGEMMDTPETTTILRD